MLSDTTIAELVAGGPALLLVAVTVVVRLSRALHGRLHTMSMQEGLKKDKTNVRLDCCAYAFIFKDTVVMLLSWFIQLLVVTPVIRYYKGARQEEMSFHCTNDLFYSFSERS